MNMKKLGTALVVVLALGAVMASSAFATATTVTVSWKTGTCESCTTVLSGTQAVSATKTENATLETTVAGSPLKLEATAISCSTCVIENSSGAKGHGFIEFTNVQVIEPATCKVFEEKVKTKELKVDATFMEGTTNLVEFKPAAGSFATIKLEKKGAPACAISGSYSVSGNVFGRTTNQTAIFKQEQGISFSNAINTAAGGALLFEAEPAILKGAAKFETTTTPRLYFGTE